MKGDFSARREEVRRDFEAPAQSSNDPNPVLSSAAEAPGTGADRAKPDAAMPDAGEDTAPTPFPTPTTPPKSNGSSDLCSSKCQSQGPTEGSLLGLLRLPNPLLIPVLRLSLR